MGRRRQGPPPKKTAIGASTLSQVQNRLTLLCAAVVTATVNFDADEHKVVDFLFPDDTKRILREAYTVVRDKMSDYHSRSEKYTVVPNVQIKLDLWDTVKMAVPYNRASRLDTVKAASFIDALNRAGKIIDDFGMVKHVVNYLDEYASLNAIRHYFPAILSLLPANHKVPFELSDRYIEPLNVGRMIPLIRDSIPVVASALMVGDPPATSGGMQLTFNGCEVVRHGVLFQRDPAFINF